MKYAANLAPSSVALVTTSRRGGSLHRGEEETALGWCEGEIAVQ